jgi:uncharacterized protein (DUF2236 family)
MLSTLVTRRLDALLRDQLGDAGEYSRLDFTTPAGEAALAGPDSVSWRLFRNPLSLLIGGISAVLLELAEPRVRSGVWDHTTFRTDPLRRMRRTGMAAMVTVYGARSMAEDMIARIGAMHARIEGTTPDGTGYRADDPELLRWVHATALFGFMEAYHHYVNPLAPAERDQFIAEGEDAAHLYGVTDPPTSEEALQILFTAMESKLEPSEIIFEFLEILKTSGLLPRPFGFLTGLIIRAAVGLLPPQTRQHLGLDSRFSLSPGGRATLRFLGGRLERIHLASTPAARACLRLGLPADYLCRK